MVFFGALRTSGPMLAAGLALGASWRNERRWRFFASSSSGARDSGGSCSVAEVIGVKRRARGDDGCRANDSEKGRESASAWSDAAKVVAQRLRTFDRDIISDAHGLAAMAAVRSFDDAMVRAGYARPTDRGSAAPKVWLDFAVDPEGRLDYVNGGSRPITRFGYSGSYLGFEPADPADSSRKTPTFEWGTRKVEWGGNPQDFLQPIATNTVRQRWFLESPPRFCAGLPEFHDWLGRCLQGEGPFGAKADAAGALFHLLEGHPELASRIRSQPAKTLGDPVVDGQLLAARPDTAAERGVGSVTRPSATATAGARQGRARTYNALRRGGAQEQGAQQQWSSGASSEIPGAAIGAAADGGQATKVLRTWPY